ncbi:MAG: hypothetical protein AABZ55_09545 [Bdellovibrionota bacterium]
MSNYRSAKESSKAKSRNFLVTLCALLSLCQPLYSFADEYDDVCGAQADPLIASQRDSYCEAAKKAKDALQANTIIWKLWAAAAVVCTGACAYVYSTGGVATATNYTNPVMYACAGSTAGATLTDAIMTREYASALTGLIASGGSFAMGGLKGAAESETVSAGAGLNEKMMGPCMSAATNTFQAMIKKGSLVEQDKSYTDNLVSAQRLNSNAITMRNGTDNLPSSNSGSAGTGATNRPTTSGSVAGGGYANSSRNLACANTSSTGQMVQCAMSGDKTLPEIFGDPKFGDEFQKIAKTDLA